MSLVAVLICLGGFSPASATVIHVPGDAATIQAGIDLAAAGDIVVVACGLYYEHNIIMKSGVCVRSQTGHPGCVIVHAQDSGRVFSCENVDEFASIQGLTITGGLATGASPADCGGGVFCSNASLHIMDCRFQWNEADNTGGAMYCLNSSPTLTNVTFEENSAVLRAGALGVEGNSFPALDQVTFIRNSAGNRGGGVYCGASSSAQLTRCTLFSNSAAQGSGVASRENSSPSIHSTIIAFGAWGEAVYNSSGAVTTLSCCDLFGNMGGDWVGSIADQYGVNGNFSADPLFCDTLSGDLHLYPPSPCADAPGCGLVGAWGAGCQSGRTWYVLPDGTGDAPSIGAAIDSAAVGDVVLVACGTYYEHDLALKSGVHLYSESGEAGCAVVDAQGLGRVIVCEHTGTSNTIWGITLTGGHATGANPANRGGGMYCFDSSPQITNCRFTGNTADLTGGGLHCRGQSSPSLSNVVFSGNSALGYGGGLGCVEDSRPVLASVAFLGNQAAVAGGAIYCYQSGSPDLLNCTLAANSAPQGSAIASDNASYPSLDRTIVAFGVGGAAVHDVNESGSVLSCCDVYGNAGGDWVGSIENQQGMNGNFSDDPAFCYPEESDCRLRSCSPCLDAPDCGLVGAFGPGPCVRTWRILCDGTGDAPTIQAGIDSAGGCDTLLVGPGTYVENVTLRSGMFLISDEGPEATTIVSAGDAGWVINGGEAGTATVVKGFTLDGAADFTKAEEERSGAYSCVYAGGGESPVLAGCTLQNALVNGVECRGNANPVVGGSPEKANRILTPVGVANFTSNTIDATYNYWGRDDHGCPENNYGPMEVVPFVDESLQNVIGDCYTLLVPEHYGSIQGAIDVATAGDTVEVAATDDIYEERVAVIDKDLTVRVGAGGGRPTIRSSVSPAVRLSGLTGSSRFDGFVVDAHSGEIGMAVDSSGATIARCWVMGATGGGLGGSGILLNGSGGFLLGNEIRENEIGILSLNSGTQISGNRVVGNQRGIAAAGNPLPQVGGSLGSANDILGNGVWNLENQESDSLNAEYNYWGTIDYAQIAATISGPVRFCYWTDSTHTEVYSCGMTAVDGRISEDAPQAYFLAQNTPNPFNPVTLVGFAIPAPGGHIEIAVYDVRGRCVRHLTSGIQSPGRWSLVWDGRDDDGSRVSPGIYFCRMKAGDYTATRKMVLVE